MIIRHKAKDNLHIQSITLRKLGIKEDPKHKLRKNTKRQYFLSKLEARVIGGRVEGESRRETGSEKMYCIGQ